MALYNRDKKREKKNSDCITCRFYDTKLKKCNGLNQNCFEYDRLTNTIIDGIAKLPIKLELDK